jgi:hypothetical protein
MSGRQVEVSRPWPNGWRLYRTSHRETLAFYVRRSGERSPDFTTVSEAWEYAEGAK